MKQEWRSEKLGVGDPERWWGGRRSGRTLRMAEWEWQHCLECFCLHRLIFVVGFCSSPYSYLPLTERNEKEDSQWGYLVARMLCLCVSRWVCGSGFPSSRWWEKAGQGSLFLKSCYFFLLTLLSVTNAWQICSRNVWESIRDYRQQRMKTYKVLVPRSRPLSSRLCPPGEARGWDRLNVCLKASLTAGAP